MALKTITVCDRCTDETTGSTDGPVAPVEFTVDGEAFVVDLCETHARELDLLRSQLAEYRQVGRPVAATQKSRSRSRAATAREERNRAIRAWSARRGNPLPPVGRIPDSVLAAYEAEETAAPPSGFAGSQLRREAEASVALDRDEHAQTVPVE